MNERPQLINSRSGKIEDLDEHSKSLLEAGTNPIFICIGTPEDFLSSGGIHFDLSKVEKVDWRWIEGKTKQEDFLSNGSMTYVMSQVNNFNKSSKGFYPCTGLVVAGIALDGEKISFLGHQNNRSILDEDKDIFLKHLEKQLLEMKERCVKGTIDAVIVGGEYTVSGFRENYLKAVKLLGEEVQKVLGFDPMVLGPKTEDWIGDDVYYDNEKRRLYLVRPKINPKVGSFPTGDIDKEKDKWE